MDEKVIVSIDRETFRTTVRVNGNTTFDNLAFEWTIADMFKVLDALGVSYRYQEV